MINFNRNSLFPPFFRVKKRIFLWSSKIDGVKWYKVFREEIIIIKDNWIAILLSNIFYFHFQKKIQFYYKYKILPLEIQIGKNIISNKILKFLKILRKEYQLKINKWSNFDIVFWLFFNNEKRFYRSENSYFLEKYSLINFRCY